MATHDVVLCGPVRTAIGAYNGSLKTIPAPELGAAVVLMRRTTIYDEALKHYPHTTVRMRQGAQLIAQRVPSAFMHEPPSRKH
jgi:acetyl-CoA acetyltransferase